MTFAATRRTVPGARDVRAGDGSVGTTAAALDTMRWDRTMTTVTVPTNTPTFQRPPITEHQHRRRDILGRLAGAAAVAAVPVTAEAASDPHPAWMTEWRAIWAAWPGGKDLKPGDPAAERVWELQLLIIDTPAATLAGLLVQTEMALINLGEEDPCGPSETVDYRLMRNLRAGLEHLAGRTAA